MKVKDYEDGRVVGEHFEYVDVEEVTQPNPMLLKFLAENKLSEKFGGKTPDNSKEYQEVIENMTPEQLKMIEEYGNRVIIADCPSAEHIRAVMIANYIEVI